MRTYLRILVKIAGLVVTAILENAIPAARRAADSRRTHWRWGGLLGAGDLLFGFGWFACECTLGHGRLIHDLNLLSVQSEASLGPILFHLPGGCTARVPLSKKSNVSDSDSEENLFKHRQELKEGLTGKLLSQS
jgi:hypothetical protein